MVSQVPQINDKTKYALDATKYLQDMPLKSQGLGEEVLVSSAMGLGFGGVISGVQGSIFAIKNRGHIKESVSNLNNTYKNIISNKSPLYGLTNYRGIELFKKAGTNAANQELVKEALKKPTVKEAEMALDAAEKTIKATNVPKGLFGKISSGFNSFKKFTHLDKLGEAVATKMPKTTKFFKGTGAPLIVALEGGIELFTEVVPAFKDSPAEGVKQLGKSTVKTAASVASFSLGMKAGALIGGTIGSAVPVVGTAIGMILGGAIGVGLSVIASKVCDTVMGDSYSTKKEKEEQEKLADEISKDDAAFSELTSMVKQKVAYEEENGLSNNDTKVMKDNTEQFEAKKDENAQNTTSFGNLTSEQNPINQQMRENLLVEQQARHNEGNYKLNEIDLTSNDRSMYKITDNMILKKQKDSNLA